MNLVKQKIYSGGTYLPSEFMVAFCSFLLPFFSVYGNVSIVALDVSIILFFYWMEWNMPNAATNRRVVEIYAKGQLGYSMTTMILSFYVINPIIYYLLIDPNRLSWSQFNPSHILAWLSLFWIGDVLFTYAHKYLLHGIWSWTHNLHHCSRHPSITALLMFHPVDLIVEFVPFFYLPFFGSVFILQNDLLAILVPAFVGVETIYNHGAFFHNDHQNHHIYAEGSYGGYPNIFPDYLGKGSHVDMVSSELGDYKPKQ